jgi:D-sedoheptulose 7-phosphate isomerase
MRDAVRAAIGASARLLGVMEADAGLHAAAARAVALCVEALRGGRKLMLCGNGGSAADAQHWRASW